MNLFLSWVMSFVKCHFQLKQLCTPSEYLLFCLKSWYSRYAPSETQKYVEILNNIWIIACYIKILESFGDFCYVSVYPDVISILMNWHGWPKNEPYILMVCLSDGAVSNTFSKVLQSWGPGTGTDRSNKILGMALHILKYYLNFWIKLPIWNSQILDKLTVQCITILVVHLQVQLYAKNIRELTKCSLKPTEVLLDADGHVLI